MEPVYDLTNLTFKPFQAFYGSPEICYPVGIRSLLPEVKRLGREAEYSPPTSDEVKKTWVYTYIPLYFFMALCLIS
jgi:hypothetical protein